MFIKDYVSKMAASLGIQMLDRPPPVGTCKTVGGFRASTGCGTVGQEGDKTSVRGWGPRYLF